MSRIAGSIRYEGNLMDEVSFSKMCEVLNPPSKSIHKTLNGKTYRLFSDSMASVDLEGRKVSIVLDGEIYHREDLKCQCRTKGFEVFTESSAELILKLYLAYHEECVTKLNGGFAFVIADERNDSFFFARDPMGIKPLFYSVRNDEIILASEIKGILKHPEVTAKAGAEELMELICLGPGRTPGKTYFQGIEELKPGHALSVTRNGCTITRYYTLHDEPWTKNEQETIETVHDLVCDAVLKQCEAEHQVCAMLSGGLDSSVVCAAAFEQVKSMNVYSVDYKGQKEHFKPSFFQPNRDQDYIHLMVEQYGLNAHEVVLSSDDLMNALKEAMIARDMPSMADVDSSLLCFLKKIKESNETVVLSGECSDEIFGGYPWYTHAELRSVEHFPWADNASERCSFLKEEFVTEDPEKFVRKRIRSSLDQLTFHPQTSEAEKQMKQLMKLNLDWFMQTLIDRADRMAHRAGISVRVPLCDLRIVDALYRIPWSMKYQNNTEKYLLRKAFEKELPEEICHRKKSPYPKTHDPHYADLMKCELRKIIDDECSPIHEIIRKEKLIELLDENQNRPWYGQLMTGPQTMAYFVQINEWLKEYHVEIIHPKG